MINPPRCIGCNRTPEEIPEYVEAARELWVPQFAITPTQYVKLEEGTYNHKTGGFACTACYLAMGEPSAPYPGWKAP